MGAEGKKENRTDRGLAVLDLDMIPVPLVDSELMFGGMTQAINALTMNSGFLATINQMAETQARLLESLKPTFKMMEGFHKAFQSITMPNFTATLTQGLAPMSRSVAEPKAWEVVDDEPQVTSVTLIEPTLDKFGFSLLIDGRFSYKGQVLRRISRDSKHGKLFAQFLTMPLHYVSDDWIKSELGAADPIKGVGYIVDDMKAFLKKDGIDVILYRQRKHGYTLEAIITR